ncbi:CRISPR-associated ring nuclease Csm6 [Candidatus Thiothrix sp. Deng01]|uniref:CRISPR-associated ring nuclease Csm6 n=1 Tax=Candidatus Thiothrix phosphatis TaxID=3112415 RepID=A0ABU6CU91_9GAMM|nr:CRISPR-associated ring nuclease Csm6 [Candidatus Thiothrix sp. Deng01]MEB4589714.1 CRISPR-associated ring nuclease Csm6 [Candidatus Thiothrix sp. Deng01]
MTTTNPSHPEQYPRRILLTLAGHSPAIITEVLYALTQTRQPAWLPTEIRIITTKSGKQKLMEGLLGENGALQHLCNDYNIRLPQVTEQHIHVITRDQQELEDIQTDADNTAAADFITELVQRLTEDHDSSLHVSIAGGRKTMTYYLGYALSLFGRMQDRLSHVLVDENRISRDFFYPAPNSDITVMLADIPFVRLREGLGFAKALSEGEYTFNRAVELVQQQFSGIQIELVNGQLYASRIRVTHGKFGRTSLAVYVWLLLRHRAGQEPIRYKSKDDTPNHEYSRELLAVYRQLHGDKGINKMENAIEATGLRADYLRPHLKHCNTALEHSLNKAAVHYQIQSIESGGYVYYPLPTALTAANIHLPIDLEKFARL